MPILTDDINKTLEKLDQVHVLEQNRNSQYTFTMASIHLFTNTHTHTHTHTQTQSNTDHPECPNGVSSSNNFRRLSATNLKHDLLNAYFIVYS